MNIIEFCFGMSNVSWLFWLLLKLWEIFGSNAIYLVFYLLIKSSKIVQGFGFYDS